MSKKRPYMPPNAAKAAPVLAGWLLNSHGWVYGLLLALCAVFYGGSLANGYVLDDYPTVLQNRFVAQGLGGLPEIFTTRLWDGHNPNINIQAYRPLTLASFALEQQFFGQNAALSHALNVLIYALCCTAVFGLVRRLAGNGWLALLTALLFTVHPVHSEPVLNLKSRDELLALLFGLQAITAYLGFLEGRKNAAIWAAFWLLLALLSKETPITFVGLAPVLAYFFGKATWRQALLKAWPLLLAAAVFLLARQSVIALHSAAPQRFTYLENPLLLAQGWSEALGTRLYLLGKNLQMLLLPHPLTSSYFFNDIPIVGLAHPLAWLSGLAYLGLAYAAYKGWKRRKPYALGIAAYGITFSIFSHLFVPFGNAMGERLLLTPSLGICLAVAGLLLPYLPAPPRFGSRRFNAYLGRHEAQWVAVLVLLALCGLRAHYRTRDWKDNLTLALADLRHSPNSYLLNQQVAQEYLHLAQRLPKGPDRDFYTRESERLLAKALKLDTINVSVRQRYAEALVQAGQYQRAMRIYDDIAKKKMLGPDSLNFYVAKIQLGQEKYEEAYQRLGNIRLNRLPPAARYEVLIQQGIAASYLHKYNEALQAFTTAIGQAEGPVQTAFAYNHIGNTYHLAQYYPQAVQAYQKAIEAYPNYPDPYNNIGVVFFKNKQTDRAIEFFVHATQINGRYARAYLNLAEAHKLKGNKANYEKYMQIYNSLK